jgi:hypothetical protein
MSPVTSVVSERQIAANRENATLGGPKTEEGKAIVRFNARKHGILSKLLTKYEEEIYEQYLDQLFEEYQPASFMEEMLVERIAVYYLRLYRSGKAENEYLQSKLQPSTMARLFRDMEDGGYKPVLKYDDMESLGNIYLRYDTWSENRLYKAAHELERWQRMRRGENIPSPLTVEVNQENGFVSQ